MNENKQFNKVTLEHVERFAQFCLNKNLKKRNISAILCDFYGIKESKLRMKYTAFKDEIEFKTRDDDTMILLEEEILKFQTSQSIKNKKIFKARYLTLLYCYLVSMEIKTRFSIYRIKNKKVFLPLYKDMLKDKSFYDEFIEKYKDKSDSILLNGKFYSKKFEIKLELISSHPDYSAVFTHIDFNDDQLKLIEGIIKKPKGIVGKLQDKISFYEDVLRRHNLESYIHA